MQAKRSKRISRVMDVAESHAQEASRDLALAEDELRKQQEQLTQLLAFRDDYASRHGAGKQGVAPAQLQNTRAFLGRLEQAIAEQRKRVERAREQVDARRAQWQQRQTRAAALGKAADRFREDERRAEARREQAELDEHGTQTRSRPSRPA